MSGFDVTTLSPEQLAALSPEQLAALSGNAQPAPTDAKAKTTAKAKAVSPVVTLKGITGSGVFVATATNGGKNGEAKPYRDGPRVRIVLTNRMGAPYTAATLPRNVFDALATMTKADREKIIGACDDAMPAWEALSEAQSA